MRESANCATAYATKGESMQIAVFPPPYPDRMKRVESVRGSDARSRAAGLTFFAETIIAMSRIMDVSSKMGPWMLRGWVRVPENSKEDKFTRPRS